MTCREDCRDEARKDKNKNPYEIFPEIVFHNILQYHIKIHIQTRNVFGQKT